MRAAIFLLWMALVLGFSCKKNESPGSGPSPSNAAFLRVANGAIVDGQGGAMTLRGIAFGNEVWSNAPLSPVTHHDEQDFVRLKDMGMNLVRFYLNYRLLEDDARPYAYKNSGWSWIDQNVQWAKKHGVYLVLNMHVPPGGFQSLGEGDALWNNTENQNRLAALWKAIAQRYKDEPQIIGYGPLNEPVPPQSISQWQQLAGSIATEIRKVDQNHILFVERAIYVKGQSESADLNFPILTDKNTVYEFHLYDPIGYTHQLFSWANQGEGGKYPDESLVTLANASWHTAIFNNPTLPAGNSAWTYFEGVPYTVTDPLIKAGIPALVGANIGAEARVYFDDLVIREYDPSGNLVQTIAEIPLSTLSGWGYWSANNSGSTGASSSSGVSGNNSIFLEGATGDCNVSNYQFMFVPRMGYRYQISGYMRGENVAANAACRIRIDFLKSPDPAMRRNRAFLDASVKRYVDWAKKKNLALYAGEYGAGIHCFQNNKGGLTWVSDMIDILDQYRLAWTYHTYHEDSFGLYFGYGTPIDPSKSNQPLIDLFKQKLR